MAQTMVNFRMDEKLKEKMEKTCKDMGLSVTAAYTMFATKVTREQRIPFEVTADPFFSEENMDRLRKSGEASGNIPQCRLKLCGKAMG